MRAVLLFKVVRDVVVVDDMREDIGCRTEDNFIKIADGHEVISRISVDVKNHKIYRVRNVRAGSSSESLIAFDFDYNFLSEAMDDEIKQEYRDAHSRIEKQKKQALDLKFEIHALKDQLDRYHVASFLERVKYTVLGSL